MAPQTQQADNAFLNAFKRVTKKMCKAQCPKTYMSFSGMFVMCRATH